MGRINLNWSRLGLSSFAKLPEHLSHNLGDSRVAAACRDARAALSAFTALRAADDRLGLKSELRTARAAFDRSLTMAQREPSRSPADVCAKWRLYQEVYEALLEDDGRIRGFAHDLLTEMA